MVKKSVVLGFLVVLASCAESPTQVIIVTDSDVAGLDRITALVSAPDGSTTQQSVANLGVGQEALPRTLALLWEQGELGPFTVRLTGEIAGTPRVERTARFTFQRGRMLLLRMDLLDRCAGVICGAEQTCAEAGCRSIDVRASELEPFTGVIPGLDGAVPPMDGGPDGGRDAGPDAGMDGGPDADIDGGTDGGPPPDCTDDTPCGVLDGPCTRGSCMLPEGMCVAMPLADTTPCDDGLFCTVGDACNAGVCEGAARDCNVGMDTCMPEACDETAGACTPLAALPDGSACDDAYTCTPAGTCASGVCSGGGPDETLCASGEVCNPVAYSATASGCGAAPTMLALTCAAPSAGSARCTIDLSAGATGIPGEARRLACTVVAAPVQLFADSFASGFDPAWTTVSGTPARSVISGGNQAATANGSGWQAEVMLAAGGLETTCVDFRVAQNNAGTGERIRWDVAFDGGTFATVFDLDFSTWEAGNQTYRFNRNVCASVPSGAASLVWRLRMDSNSPAIWVDDVAISGISAPRTVPANGGPDDMSATTGWTFAGGTTPYLGTFGGSSVMFAEQESYTATRGAIDASACDVLDVDFDFGYAPGAASLDNDDDIRLEVSVDGGAFTLLEFVNLNDGSWNPNSAILPWLGLRRITDRIPAAAGAGSVVLRFRLSADNPSERVWIDDFEVGCADLAEPTLGSISDEGGGAYGFDVSSALPVDARVTCTWASTNDGPLDASATVSFLP